MRLGRDFFADSALEVAKRLIGCELACDGVAGVIVETESYRQDDPACHAYRGMTDRNKILFGEPGLVYVYLSYGVHNLLNFVVEQEGRAAAVLIRALEPTRGVEKMNKRRLTKDKTQPCSGPGKLSQAMGITLKDNGSNLFNGRLSVRARSGAWQKPRVVSGPRIGISAGKDRPWRFYISGNPHLSRA